MEDREKQRSNAAQLFMMATFNLSKNDRLTEAANNCFYSGALWADNNPYWIDGNDLPSIEYTPEGLPKLYLCQIMTLDATFGWRFSYRVGFINDDGKWNLETSPLTRVTKYMHINCDESDDTKMKYIEQFNKNI